MTFCIEFDTDNAAFQPNARMEITAILREVIAWIDRGKDVRAQTLRDSNGNAIGHVTWDDERAQAGRS